MDQKGTKRQFEHAKSTESKRVLVNVFKIENLISRKDFQMPKSIIPKAKSILKTKARSKKAAAAKAPQRQPQISKAERAEMVQLAAYHLAEKDGFQPGKEQDYWLQAERQVFELYPESEKSDVH